MSTYVMKHPKLNVAGSALENHATSLEITTEYDEVEDTAFCSDLRTFQQGLGDATWTITFNQDHAANSVDEILWPYSQSGGTFLIKASPGSAAVSATNPMYSMTARLFSYSPIAGGIGDLSTTDVTFRNAGTAGITRSTAGTV